MTQQQAKPTPGPYSAEPWILGGSSGRMITTSSGYVGDGFIADVDTKENAALIAEAGTVYHETGMTPRQLLAQRDALLEALHDVKQSMEDEHISYGTDGAWEPEAYKIICVAIAAAKTSPSDKVKL